MRVIYTIGIGLYTLGIRMAALFGHSKARQMVEGWKHWSEAVDRLKADKKTVWFHAASLGEFEQARPVLEAYRHRHPDEQVLVTFFSPSGYEVRKNYAQAEAVCYLPMDTPHNVRRFVCRVNPYKVFFVKYEFWYNYLNTLRQRSIPTYIFSAIFRPEQYFFKPWGRWFVRQLRDCYTHLFVQNEESLQLLRTHGIEQCTITGDTRFDRVHQIAVTAESDDTVERWLDGHVGSTIVCGSTWPPDEAMISELRKQDTETRIILAPHVINEEHLKQIEHLFPDSTRYSLLTSGNSNAGTANTLIIDNIGMLSKLYRYATVAYIGGGFGVGIHNILEAVTFGKPVLFGPNYHKFKEARDIIALGGGFCHHDAEELQRNIEPLLTDSGALERASHNCLAYMQENLGSTTKIMDTIEK